MLRVKSFLSSYGFDPPAHADLAFLSLLPLQLTLGHFRLGHGSLARDAPGRAAIFIRLALPARLARSSVFPLFGSPAFQRRARFGLANLSFGLPTFGNLLGSPSGRKNLSSGFYFFITGVFWHFTISCRTNSLP